MNVLIQNGADVNAVEKDKMDGTSLGSGITYPLHTSTTLLWC